MFIVDDGGISMVNESFVPLIPLVPFKPVTWDWDTDDDETFSTLSVNIDEQGMTFYNPCLPIVLPSAFDSDVMDIDVPKSDSLVPSSHYNPNFHNNSMNIAVAEDEISSDSSICYSSSSEENFDDDISSLSSHLSFHQKGKHQRDFAVIAELPILSLDRLDPSGLPILGNVIAKPNSNFDEAKYLLEKWTSDASNLYDHPLLFSTFKSKVDTVPQGISIQGPVSIIDNGVFDDFEDPEVKTREFISQSEKEKQDLQADLVRRAMAVASRYDPVLIHGGNISDPLSAEKALKFADFLISIDYKFAKGNAEFEAAEAAIHAGFNWDNFNFAQDEDLISKHHGNIAGAVAEKQVKFSDDRISLEKITLHLSDYPDFIKLARVVTEGVTVYPDLDYRKSPYEDLRKQEKTLVNVIAQHAIKSWQKGRLLIVRESSLKDRQIRHLNFSASFWVPKVGDVFGRWCIDCSNRSDDRIALNGGRAKEFCILKAGKVVYPQMPYIVSLWIQYKIEKGIAWSDMWIFKEDIKSCFNQLNFRPKSALHLAQRLAEGIFGIHCCGNFGYTGLPGNWQIVGNALMWLIDKEKKTPVILFCDDFGSAGTFEDTLHDSNLVTYTITNVIGKQAVAADKHSHNQCEVFLGWMIDFLNKWGASICPKPEAMEKLFYYMFSFDERLPQSRKLWESIAALVERYSNGIFGSRPFVNSFHKMVSLTLPTAQDQQKHYHWHRIKKEKATPSALMAIEFWRSVCILWWLEPSRFAVPLEHYVAFNGISMSPHEYVGISDSCSKRTALGIYKVNNGSLDNLTLLAWMSVPFGYVYPPNKPTSAFQNSIC